MYQAPSSLSASARAAITAELNARLVDGLDLHSQLKLAHWNVRGPQFAALHPLFEQFALALAVHTDALAERAVTLGALAVGTARQVASRSTLPEYAVETTRGEAHIQLLAERFDVFLQGLRTSRTLIEHHADADSADLLTAVIGDFEKHAWFMRASLA